MFTFFSMSKFLLSNALQLTDEFLAQVYFAETWFYPTLQHAFKTSIEKIMIHGNCTNIEKS